MYNFVYLYGSEWLKEYERVRGSENENKTETEREGGREWMNERLLKKIGLGNTYMHSFQKEKRVEKINIFIYDERCVRSLIPKNMMRMWMQ